MPVTEFRVCWGGLDKWLVTVRRSLDACVKLDYRSGQDNGERDKYVVHSGCLCRNMVPWIARS